MSDSHITTSAINQSDKITLENNALTHWDGAFGLPDFNAFTDNDFGPAFEAAITQHLKEIEAIVANEAEPSIDNVLKALQLSGKALERVSSIFWMRAGAHSNEAIQALERDIAPKMSRHYSRIMMDPMLFAKVDALYEKRSTLNLDSETLRVLEKIWKGFVRSGAKLDKSGKAELARINEELASLGASFSQHVLKDESQWALYLDTQDDLAGLPDFLRNAMRNAAHERGRTDAWAVTLSRSIIEPFLTFSQNRNLREVAFNAWAHRGQNNDANDNQAIVAQILRLRDRKAHLLGYDNFAAFKLDDTMAKSPHAVMNLLEPVWEKARAKASEEEAEIAELIIKQGSNHKVAPWDWRFYAEQLRTEKFAFDEAELKPYLQLDNIIQASFEVANRLFGLSFKEQKGITTWHPDVRVFEVFNADGSRRGLFLSDYFARTSKRSGAWMSVLQSAHKLNGGQPPIIYNVMNFAKPITGEPALLSLDDARTLFHEFGHALHGLLTDVTWPAVAGTVVSRDFVELPSQLYEHWLTVPEILEKYAVHYRTGDTMPKALLDKVLAAQTFNAGFQTVEFTASALVDMAFHTSSETIDDPIKFEQQTLAKLSMPDAIIMRHRTPHFTHVFSGDGYSAGYYSYMWSEVLDADAFAAFEESGDPFNPELAANLKKYIYAAGGSADPEELYKKFRGQMPSPEAMIANRGLNK